MKAYAKFFTSTLKQRIYMGGDDGGAFKQLTTADLPCHPKGPANSVSKTGQGMAETMSPEEL